MSYTTETQNSHFAKEVFKKIRILVVDDQNLICTLLPVALKTELDLEVVGTANDGATALELATKLEPDIALIDIEMPGMDGIETTRKFCQSFPETKVVILSSHDQEDYVEKAFDAGAKGYLLKNTSSEELARAIRFIDRNYVHFSQGLFPQIEPNTTETTLELQKELEQDGISNLKLISPSSDEVNNLSLIHI
jgi:DNA-binding NarL/FixJ family response regulator